MENTCKLDKKKKKKKEEVNMQKAYLKMRNTGWKQCKMLYSDFVYKLIPLKGQY